MFILGIVVFVFGVIIVVSMLIPLSAAVIASSLLGRQAKFNTEDKLMLMFYFYWIMWALMAVAIFLEPDNGGGFLAFLLAIFAALIWPFPIGITTINYLFFGQAAPTDAYILFGLGFCVTQLIAVFMILKRARSDTGD